MDVAVYAAAGQDFRALFGIDLSDNLTGNLNLTDCYVRTHYGVLSNHEPVLTKNRPCEISIDAKHAAKVQFAV